MFYTFNHTDNSDLNCSLSNYANLSTSINLSNFTQDYSLAMSYGDLIINFFDEQTEVAITTNNIYASIIGTINATNLNTTVGSMTINGILTGDYEVRYFGTNYPNRTHFFSVSTNTTTYLKLYLLNGSSTTTVTNTLYDEAGNILEGYYIKICLLYTSPSPRDRQRSRMPSSA